MPFRKIINDPVYGFITIDDPLIAEIIAHPYFQRLRRIHQMALASLVYPGAVHSRLLHALGAYHLMRQALREIAAKGIEITPEENQGAKIAILLHDIGHGPYSHALENELAIGYHHEQISIMLMNKLNDELDGKLQRAIEIFTGEYHKPFLHQLVSGQLDVDRMDYLTRDSFFSGVSEGVIGYDRILKMLTVHNGRLVVEEKGIYSIEKFLIARRQMYWQVYLHKTVLSAEQMLKRVIRRAREIGAVCAEPLNSFLHKPIENVTLQDFCAMDDDDVMVAIKGWCSHPDKILSLICKGIRDRKTFKLELSNKPVNNELVEAKKHEIVQRYGIPYEDAHWLVFTGEANSSTYNLKTEHICILFKSGEIRDITQVDNALIGSNMGDTMTKYYFSFIR